MAQRIVGRNIDCAIDKNGVRANFAVVRRSYPEEQGPSDRGGGRSFLAPGSGRDSILGQTLAQALSSRSTTTYENMDNKPTVFVVDADGVVCDSIGNLAHTMNLQCETYASGWEFLEAYDPDRPGCLVLEIKIPDVNGVQIQERLSNEGSILPIIFLTNQATVSIAVRAMRCGALHVIEKPFREHELWDAVHEAVELNLKRREQASQWRELEERVSQLSVKDQAHLKMISQGESKEAMAAELGVCVRTVELRRNQLMKKLGLQTPVELIQFALAASNGHARQNHTNHSNHNHDTYCRGGNGFLAR